MAVASKVDICNMALDHLGKPPIASLTEGSVEAQTCLRQYDIARRGCLIRSPWTFARRQRALSIREDNPIERMWTVRHDLPNDSLKLHRIDEGWTDPRLNSPPQPYYLEAGTVYSHMPNAVAYYTFDSNEVLVWSTLFDDAVALALALRMTPAMTRRKSDADLMRNVFREALAEAIEFDAMQEQTTYTYYDGGYADARDGAGTGARRMSDGSVIWE
jgi:hypothetical protein